MRWGHTVQCTLCRCTVRYLMHYALCMNALICVTRAAARLPGEDEVALAGQAAVTEDEVGVLDELKVSPFQALLTHM